MELSAHQQIITDRIRQEVAVLLPNGAGTVTAVQLQGSLGRVATAAFSEGQSYALLSLLTIEDVARELGVSIRRARTIAADRHEKLGVGWQVPGTGTWLFRPEELDTLRPGAPGRPRASR